MPIEITKRGEIPNPARYVGACNHCHTELRCAAEDGELIDDPREQLIMVKLDCPVCKRVMWAYEQTRVRGF